ncbi:MAG: hypothetical protein HY791_04640 [Deltaproteobacteria bacterium]|nr:hypothetical protein [Deltaproteobacteria bacterium]
MSKIEWTINEGSVVAELGVLEVTPKDNRELGWWDWIVLDSNGESVAEGVSWRSGEEAKACAEAVARLSLASAS